MAIKNKIKSSKGDYYKGKPKCNTIFMRFKNKKKFSPTTFTTYTTRKKNYLLLMTFKKTTTTT